MRLVFVNHAHPETPHVSGMRLGHFADAMARRGHAVILLTASLPERSVVNAEVHAELGKLAERDWGAPLVVPVRPQTYRPVEVVRQRALPSVLRRALTAWLFVRHGGVFADWTLAALPIAQRIAEEFKPDLVWATFGNTSNLWLAQSIAKRAGCPWVMDVKDNWEAFVPVGLRQVMARRFSDAAGMTSNARHHQLVASRWLKVLNYAVIYSGVGETFFAAESHEPDEAAQRDIVLVGSTYDEDRLSECLGALSAWLAALPPRELERIRFVYAGSDHVRVRALLARSPLPCQVEINGQLPLQQLASCCKRALVNCYLWAPSGFHHKLLELLVAGAPVVAYPGEHEESLNFAASTTTPFFVCADAIALRDAFAQVWKRQAALADDRVTPPWRWDDFAEELEALFFRVRT